MLKFLGLLMALLVLAALGLAADMTFNNRHLFYAMLGRDGIVSACTPVLANQLRAAGFEPTDVELGDRPDITVSSWAGKTLEGGFTFLDGSAMTRVDGIVACVVENGRVRLEFRTRSTPVRAG